MINRRETCYVFPGGSHVGMGDFPIKSNGGTEMGNPGTESKNRAVAAPVAKTKL